MLARGEGYLLHTASAAGLLTQLGDLPYSVTKHAVVALAEWLAITYGDAGIRVSCLCPQGVRTGMLTGVDESSGGGGVLATEGLLEPEEVADAVVDAIGEEQFLVLPHPEVLEYFRRKADDYDRWLRGMRRLRALRCWGGRSMRAWQVHRHGEPADALVLAAVDPPEPAADQVRLRVRARPRARSPTS